jgi:hypothetical protein
MPSTVAKPDRASRAMTGVPRRAWTIRALVALAGFACGAAASAAALEADVRFAAYTPLSQGSEIARRLLTPLTYARLEHYLAAHHVAMREQSVELAQEHFVLHVPAGAPPEPGYGLLVFVPPWPQAELPQGWARELDRRGLIYVSMANAGNAADVIDRRVPLALLAWANVGRRYPLDPARVYVGGFSGGARVALRIALGYPDVFHGALLEAGSDPPGSVALSLPPATLLHRFQQDTRLVFLTGGQDAAHLQMDAASRRALRRWCVTDLARVTPPWLGHAIAGAADLGRALDALAQPAPPDPGVLAACRARNEAGLAAALSGVRDALDHGDRRRAQRQLAAIDMRFGGLAAAPVLELQARLDKRPP